MIPLKTDIKLGTVDLDDNGTTQPLVIVEIAMCGDDLQKFVGAEPGQQDPIGAAKAVAQWLLDNVDAAKPERVGGPYDAVMVVATPAGDGSSK